MAATSPSDHVALPLFLLALSCSIFSLPWLGESRLPSRPGDTPTVMFLPPVPGVFGSGATMPPVHV